MTFTLPGFNTVKREGIELTGTFTASVNADANPVLAQSNAFATWQRPQRILNPRLAKVARQMEF